MSSPLVIGLDVGTTACKALAVAGDGRVVASAAAEYPLHAPQAGWAEQDVDGIWRGVCAALRELTAKVDAGRLTGLALSGAMHSVLPVDDAGNPLRNAMTWADNRAFDEARLLRESPATVSFYSRTGCPVQWLYLPAKLRWLARHDRAAFDGAARFVAIKDFIVHRLNGKWATDICLASGSGLLDLRSHTWHDDALAAAGISAARLPALVEPHAVIGHITASAAQATGLPDGLPVMPGGGDGGMANIGAGAAEPGGVVVTVGTSGAVRVTTDAPRLDARQRTWCYVLTKDRWYAGGAINNGGLAVDAVRRLLYADLPKEKGFELLFAEADGIAPDADGPLILPYFAGERSPHWRPDLKASLHGLTHSHERAHVARAVLEGVAFCLADVWEAVAERGSQVPSSEFGVRSSEFGVRSYSSGADVFPTRNSEPGTRTFSGPVLLTGGITRSRIWSQVVCDVLGVPVTLVDVGDASALGAAAVGHLGLGNIPSLGQWSRGGEPLATLSPREEYRAVLRERHAAFQREAMAAMARPVTG